MSDTDFPDIELVVCDLLNHLGRSVTFIPKDYNDVIKSTPILRVVRTGGGSLDGRHDFPIVQVGVISGSRAQSWSVMGQVRTVIRELCINGPGTVTGEYCDTLGGVKVLESGEHVGPMQLPEMNPDNRLVQMMFQFKTVRPR